MDGKPADSVRLTNQQVKQLLEAMLDAFTTWSALSQLLQLRCERALDHIVARNCDLRDATLQVINAANREGWMADLLGAVAEERPNLPQLQSLTSNLLSLLKNPLPVSLPVVKPVEQPSPQPGEPDIPGDFDWKRLITEMMLDRKMRTRALEELYRLDLGPHGPRHREAAEALLTVMLNKEGGVNSRIEAGNALNQLGDPRFRAEAWYLPVDEMLGFVKIPEGMFLMGANNDSCASPLHKVNLPTYYIARFPVTVNQYKEFLKKIHPGQDSPTSIGQFGNHPVVNVSWYDAVEYCQWLTEKLQRESDSAKVLADLPGDRSWTITLPSEAEWEKAARGSKDSRPYPWGIERPTPDRANYEGSGFHSTSPVGCHPDGASPYGAEEMSGNVLEWTRSMWGPHLNRPQYDYPYNPFDGRENLQEADNSYRVLRGGSFDSSAEEIQCTSRCKVIPTVSHQHVGFRLALMKLE